MNATKPASPFRWHGHLDPKENRDILITRTDVEGNNLVLDICRGVRRGDYSAILSSRQTGKTTLLHQILYKLKADEIQICPIIIDLSTSSDWEKPRANFYRKIADRINQNVVAKAQNMPEDAASFTEFIRQIIKRESLRLLLMLDEAEEVPSGILRPFFSALRSMWSEYISCILVGSEHLRRIETVGNISPLFNIMNERRLADFSEQNIQRWAKHIEEVHDIHFEAKAISSLYEYASGHPYLTQKICDLAYEKSDGTITAAGIRGSVKTILTDDGHLIQMIQKVKGDEEARALLSDILKEREVIFRPNSSPIAKLLAAGAITDRDGICRVRNELYGKALRQEAEAQESNIRIIARPVVIDDSGDITLPVSVVNDGPDDVWLRDVYMISGDSEPQEQFYSGRSEMHLSSGKKFDKEFEVVDISSSRVRVLYRYSNGKEDVIDRSVCPIPNPEGSESGERSVSVPVKLRFDDDWLLDMMNISFATYSDPDEMITQSLDKNLPDEVLRKLGKFYLPDKLGGAFDELLRVAPIYEKLFWRSIPRPKRYQDLFGNGLREAYFGEYLLHCRNDEGKTLIDLLCQYDDPDFSEKPAAVKNIQRDRMLKTWWIAAMFHDVGHDPADALAGKTDETRFDEIMGILGLNFDYADRERQSGEVIETVIKHLGLEEMKSCVGKYNHGAIGAHILIRYCQRFPQPIESLPFDLNMAAQALLLNGPESGSSIRLSEYPLAAFLIIINHAQMWGRPVIKREEGEGAYQISLVRELNHIEIQGLSLSNVGLRIHGDTVSCHVEYKPEQIADTDFDFEKLCAEKKSYLDMVLLDAPGFPRFTFHIKYEGNTETVVVPTTTSPDTSVSGLEKLKYIKSIVSHLSVEPRKEEIRIWLTSIRDVLQHGSEKDGIACVSILRDEFDELTADERSDGVRIMLDELKDEQRPLLARRILSFLGGHFDKIPSSEQSEVYRILLGPLSDEPALEGTRLKAAASIMGKTEDDSKRQGIFEMLFSILVSDKEDKRHRESTAEALVNYAVLTDEQKKTLESKVKQLYIYGDLAGNRYLGNYLASRNLVRRVVG